MPIGLLVGCWLLIVTEPIWAQTGNQAALVVVHGNGSVITQCIDFSEPQLSGYDLLQRSGLDLNVEVAGMGAAICRIDHEGCTYPQQSCFCQTEGSSYTYWSYWRQTDAGWRYSQLGASNQTVLPGAVEGWVWGAGTVDSAPEPPPLTFAEICAPATPTVSPTPSPAALPTTTDTPAPTPTMTVVTASATATPFPSATATLVVPPTATWLPSPTPSWTPLLPASLPGTATPAPPQIVLFAAEQSTLTSGQTTRLLWQVVDAREIVLQGNDADQPVGSVGNLVVNPLQTTTYTLVARNGAGESRITVVVTVNPAPINLATATLVMTTPLAVASVDALPPIPLPAPTVADTIPVTPTTLMVTSPVTVAGAMPLSVALAAAVVPTAAATPLVLAPIVLSTHVWATATSEPGQVQRQLLTILGRVAVVLALPLVVLALGVLFWTVRNRA
ncbi:MAG: hypothetical protein KF832_26305 [Caldilineaceae bacterium]|nr:hypothetical protein [Caldilineaceae bacterium]